MVNFEDLFKNVYNINFVDELFSEEDLLKMKEICSKLNIKPIDLTHKSCRKYPQSITNKDEILNEILSLQKNIKLTNQLLVFI